jgi:checkpoint serine/threonine-protein kinase
LKILKPAISTYDGFIDEEYHDAQRVPKIEQFIAKMTRKDGGVTQNLEMHTLLGGVDYAIHRKLGQGAFAPVFLAEALDTGVLYAIKVEKNPPSKWEFYLMRQAKRRLGVSRAADSMIDAIGLHLFRNESYLILEYRDQGTILDLVNSAKVSLIGRSSTGVMDETLAMFLAIELVRSVENLHSKNILHGDLKADNCLIRFDESELTDSYRRDGSGGWDAKGIALIDFGRGVDMKLFPNMVQFIADWETDGQDCPEMREMRPWTFQVDYWGLAGIIRSMLYGKYITTRMEPVGMGKKRYLLKESFKRYWQQDLWKGLLEVLLNPGLVTVEEGTWPITHKLKERREKMEAWLEENSERGVGLRGIIRGIELERRAGR